MLNSMTNPSVVVAVGTDHHRFDRLVTWTDSWAAANPEVEVLIQRGTSIEPETAASAELIPHLELCERFARSLVVVSHGGPSTIMDARQSGRNPIVVPRDPSLGEHVDDHQMRFADHLARHDLAVVVSSRQELHRLLDEAMVDASAYAIEVTDEAIEGVVRFGRQLDHLLATTTTLASPVVAIQDPSVDQERSA